MTGQAGRPDETEDDVPIVAIPFGPGTAGRNGIPPGRSRAGNAVASSKLVRGADGADGLANRPYHGLADDES